jgi:hypothetical protein
MGNIHLLNTEITTAKMHNNKALSNDSTYDKSSRTDKDDACNSVVG